MKGILIGTSAIISIGLLGGLSYMVKKDFDNSNIPIERINITENELNLSYNEYDLDKRFLHSLYSNVFSIEEIEDKNPIYSFENKFNENKEVYTVRGDSIAITYKFNEKNLEEKNKFNKFKKDVYKKKLSGMLNSNVDSIYISKTSNIMQTAYIVEFKEPMSINDIFKYTSNIVENDKLETEKEAKFIKEHNGLVELYDSTSKYKRVNVSFSFSGNKAIIRNLVSEKQDLNEVNQTYQLIFKNKK
jgi:hypothetical protein